MLDRQIIPKGSSPRSFIFPDWSVKTLDNGLKIVFQQDNSLPQISFRLMIPVGSTIDGQTPGIASLTADLLSRGTSKRTSTQLFEDVEFIGGHLNSGCNWDATFVSVSSLSSYTDEALDILAEVLLDPAFSEQELKFIVEQRLNNLMMNKDSTGYLANTAIGHVLFSGHPFQFPGSGTELTLPAFTRSEVSAFYQANFHPLNSVLIITGDFKNADELLGKVSSLFSGWKKGVERIQEKYAIKPISKTEVVVVHKPDAVQSTIRIAHHGIDKMNADLPKITIMNTLLGGYFGSRINMNIREDKGFTYGARTYFTERKNTGHFAVTTDVRNEVTGEAVKEILFEMNRLKSELVTEAELSNVKNYLVGRFPVDFETTDQVSNAIMETMVYDLPKNYFTAFRDSLKLVTRQDILEMANQYLQPETCAVIVSGHAPDIVPQLQPFGTVRLLDTTLNPLSI